jgi:transposase InsO family protein
MGKVTTCDAQTLRTQRWQAIADDRRGGQETLEVALKYGVSERTVQRIVQGCDARGRVRRACKPGPRKGEVGSRTPKDQVELVCAFKSSHPGKGHHYCHHWLKRQGLHPPAPVTIWRIWRLAGLLSGKRKRQPRRVWDALTHAPGFFQLDTLYIAGGSFAFSAVETRSRYGFVKLVPRRDAQSAAQFLLELQAVYPGRLSGVQTDNGGEFAGAFAAACRAQGLPHYQAWVRCPDQNGKVERFNRTLREETLLGTDNPGLPMQVLQADIARFLEHYNYHRPHAALDWHTPIEYLSSQTGLSLAPG